MRIPTPPTALRRGPLREGAFPSPLHEPRTAVAIGRWLGAALVVCLVTGLISHALQDWHLPFPSRPVNGYRFTQGLHVISGTAMIPLLGAKLWTVYPRLFAWPPVQGVLHGLERAGIALLVSAVLLELCTGLVNAVQWYPWPFPFRQTHFWLAWIAAGGLLVHLAAKAPLIAANWWRARVPAVPARRGFLFSVAAATGLVTAVTAGQTVPWLRRLVLLAPRRPDIGPQGLPVNKTAAQAGTTTTPADWRLSVDGPRPFALDLAELAALPQRTVRLPISCVEGWSAMATWTGIRLSDLLDRAGIAHDATVRVTSREQQGDYRVTEMAATYARDPLTLLALRVNGEILAPDHGHPARIIAPNRPGVLQTKWVDRLEGL
ncbi:DMSO/TMAO reductase YedYZ molybdopterin-dependent catalytic subunit [Actinocorallia herbida]|uniref:DMSO/TMAO reductase YedYZ molybdopterin-dependent catalytic subunit n=1 Tax=Actinocorallia herbida TaxID=58109 RepID=A0A3N1D2F2_9ACTN|nr:molybdopterin-dependent oxidoreductase [Actinocorallia herbida]ROO87719.1 DMSO/TMAO reductase YedYZ molybdopterin-dependent catalytic subunit [Actinocorallia herbida]